jgi:hypothetical protein
MEKWKGSEGEEYGVRASLLAGRFSAVQKGMKGVTSTTGVWLCLKAE